MTNFVPQCNNIREQRISKTYFKITSANYEEDFIDGCYTVHGVGHDIM